MPLFFLLISNLNYPKQYLIMLPLALVIVSVIGMVGTYNRYASKEIQMDFGRNSPKIFAADLPAVKKIFADRLQNVLPGTTLRFNNMNDFIFYTLLNQGVDKRACIINNQFPKGISTNENGLVIPFSYYGD
jgi:hypothetical protein